MTAAAPTGYINALGATLSTASTKSFWAALPGTITTGVGGGHTLYGDAGNDAFYIYSATDQVVLPPSHGVDTIYDGAWGTPYTLAAGVQNLVLSNEQEVGVGNSLNNLIIAASGSATMSGGGGDDIFVDGTGADTIIDPQGSGSDVIYSFKNGVDHVDLQNSTSLFSFSSVTAAMQQVGSDVVLNLGGNESLTFRNEVISNFVASDFWLPVDTAAMSMTFDDEFNSLSASPNGAGTTWETTYSGSMRTNGGGEFYSDSSVGVNPFSVSNGVLTITAAPTTPSASNDEMGYTSGVITTQKSFSQLYGYFETRAEMPAGAGFWPAFWLLPANNTWPPELDAVEQLTSNSTSDFVTAHTDVGGFNTQVSYNVSLPNTSQGFHTYGVYWGPDYIRWYFDGQQVAMTATPADMNTPMYMLVNLGVVTAAGTWEGATASGATGQMQVDYVHAYAYTGSDPMITGYGTSSGGTAGSGSSSGTPPAATQAVATVSATKLDFGTVHVGDVASRGITITNSASGSDVDLLTGGFGSVSGAFAGAGTLGSGLASGASGTLTIAIATGTTGTEAGLATLALDSQDSVSGSTALDASSIQLTGTVDNYASASLSILSGNGTLTGSGTSLFLNLGTISPQSSGDAVRLALTNSATGAADLLSSSFSSTGGNAFYNGGLSSASGLAAGQADTAPSILFASAASGTYTETIVITPSGSNSSGYIGALPTETLTVTGTVAPIYNLTTGNDTCDGGAGNDTFITTAAELGSGDTIYGAGGTNTLELVGGGTFDLSKVSSLSSIQIVTVQEGSGSAEPTLKMRDYMNVTVNVEAPASGTGGVVIQGGNDSDVFNLGTGNDVVYLGSSHETVIGHGADTIYAAGSALSTTINGGGAGSTLVVNASGSNTLGNNVTNIGTIKLAPTSGSVTFKASGLKNVAIVGGVNGGDTITLGDASQSVTGGGHNEHVLATAAIASAQVSGLGANSTFEITNGGTIALNASTGGSSSAPLTVKLDQASHLSLSGMSFITALGSSGADTITANATNQTLTGGVGADTLVGFSGGQDTFRDIAAGLNGDTILGFNASDVIDLTDLAFKTATCSYSASTSILSVTDGSKAAAIVLPGSFSAGGFMLASDGQAGTKLTWHS